ncbi:hypothetical protein CVT26_004202 [Gymnopilus dilepis]|uniref:Uncharacterized protein n=1 Tax=Gymnopilus dilepis TaxID=231916 RepID=A0A409WU33_9AGAR|nr:hypothetical protein CVT26_004202 [Gymnopilus dilepis]
MESVKEAAGGLPWVHQEVNMEDPSPNLGSATGDGYGSTRQLTQAHFIHAIREVPSSSAGSSHSKLNKWHERFGRKTRQDENHLNTPGNRAPAGNRPPDPIQNVGPPPAAAVGWVMGTAFINVPMSYLS